MLNIYFHIMLSKHEQLTIKQKQLLTRPQYLGVAGPLVLHLGCMLLQQSLVQNVLPVHYQLVRLLQQLVELQINKLAYFLTFFPS